MNQASFNKIIQKAQDQLGSLISMPKVTSAETAEKVWKGFKAIRDMKASEREKLVELSVQEAAKEFGSDDVKVALRVVEESTKMVGDFMGGQLATNEAFQQAQRKNVLDASRDDDKATMIVDYARELQTGGVDLGWMPAYVARNATNAQEIKRLDMNSIIRFVEVSSVDEIPPKETMSGKQNERYGPRFISARVEYSDDDFRFSTWTLNDILSRIQQAYSQSVTYMAYKRIFEYNNTFQKYTTSDISEASRRFLTVSNAKDINFAMAHRGRNLLNIAHTRMVNIAMHRDKTDKKRVQSTESKLPIGPLDPIYVYFNHEHREFFDLLGRMIPGEDGVNSPLLDNWIFVPTYCAPLSGGWTVTGETDSTERDEWGLYGTIAEQGKGNAPAAMAVIPGLRNEYATFRNMYLINTVREEEESTRILAKARLNFVMDDRQKALIEFGKYPTVS